MEKMGAKRRRKAKGGGSAAETAAGSDALERIQEGGRGDTLKLCPAIRRGEVRGG